MRSFEIFVDTETKLVPRAEGAEVAPRSQTRARRGREVLDVFVRGANVTARISERNASCVLRDLAYAVAELSRAPRGKRIVRSYDDAWELALERLGDSAALSVYRPGPEPRVFAYDVPIVWSEVRDSVREAVERALAKPRVGPGLAAELETARDLLGEPSCETGAEVPAPMPVSIEIDRDAPIAFACEFTMRAGDARAIEPSVERADLHALLFRGRVRAEVRGRAVDLGDAHPFLMCERLLALSREALSVWERGQAMHVRSEAGGVLIGLRVSGAKDAGICEKNETAAARKRTSSPTAGGPEGTLALALGAVMEPAGDARGRALYTFPALGVIDVVEASLAYARALVRAILRRDRAQSQNLRLAALRRQIRETSDTVREVRRQDAKINHAPESYRAFALRARATSDAIEVPSRLRYSPRWRALVPGVDLRATFLCGDRLIVGGAAETFCLDRSSGHVVWRAPTERAASVVTPAGVARIHADGAIHVHDFASGDITLRTWIAPRIGGPATGAVVNTPGLPRLLVVTEGERHLVALDLASGEARWRYAWGKGGALRTKRAGKLLYIVSGDSGLTALDVTTGAVIWRARNKLRFRAAPSVDHEELFALAGGASSATELYAFDPYSGRVRWSRIVPSPSGGPISTAEGSPLVGATTVALALRERHGLGLIAFSRATGDERFRVAPSVAPVGTSWLAVDDLFVGNTPTGELVAICAETGRERYRHALGRALETDVPRRLEPVLRSGALFVPHVDVHVFRPRDGVKLATVGPCDAIPDLLRVDERCDVYVAEESGHMAAFGAGPSLSLVR